MIDIKDEEFIVPAILPPREDGVFKTLLTHPSAGGVLKDLIESILMIKVKDIHIRANELPLGHRTEKQERFDVNCVTDNDEQIEIEMQAQALEGDAAKNHKITKDRGVYYLCDLHAKQEGRGRRYDKFLRSYQINFCGFTIFDDNSSFINYFNLRNEDGVVLTDAVNIIFIELSKLGKILDKPAAEMSGAEMWSIFFEYADDPKFKDKLNEIMGVRGEIAMATEILDNISRDEDEIARFRARRKFELDQQHNLSFSEERGREAGRKEGIKEGIKEGKADTARKMLAMGLDINTIMQITDLSREEITKLSEQ
ncbi:MAG: Rpn family recombination-promoting nuclease/putative transposase [Eubacterium sp.]|nr:Rpn family recombination-promoting nuclease/putative transposase [Eubacterium sp.]